MKFECTVSIGLVGCKQTFVAYIEDEDLEEYEGTESENFIFKEVLNQAFDSGLIELSWEEAK